jgi:Tfp pilus assembly protein PilO
MGSMDSKRREKPLAILTVVILGAVFLFASIIDPQLKKYRTLSSRLALLQLDLTKARGNLLIKDRIEKTYTQISPLITLQNSQQQQISEFTRLLDQIYSKLNVKIRSVKILPAAEENYYRKLSIRIEMTGFVKDFLSFIEAVEQCPSPIKIEQFDLTAQELQDTVMVSMIISRIVSAEDRPAGKR